MIVKYSEIIATCIRIQKWFCTKAQWITISVTECIDIGDGLAGFQEKKLIPKLAMLTLRVHFEPSNSN